MQYDLFGEEFINKNDFKKSNENYADNKVIISELKYNLNNQEIEMINKMSENICNQKRDFFVNNFKRDKTMSLHEMNINGFGAELAFCALCGVIFDSSTVQSENHFTKVDCTLKDGRTVDVKNTIYENGKLIARLGKEKTTVDLFALMTGKFPCFTFRGWAKYIQLIDNKNIKDLGWGNAYCLNQSELNKELLI
jgi:hypothetical protein